MAEIGYGHSREQISDAVRQIIEKHHRPNPFRGGSGSARNMQAQAVKMNLVNSSSGELDCMSCL